jgi:hypothetical protein
MFARAQPERDTYDVQAAEELGRRAGLAIAKQYYREQHVATLQRAFPFIPRDVIAIITVQFGVGNRQWRFEAGVLRLWHTRSNVSSFPS